MKIDVGLLDRRIDDEILGDEPSAASTFFLFLSVSKFTVSVIIIAMLRFYVCFNILKLRSYYLFTCVIIYI